MPGTSDDSAADSRLAERLTEIAVRACAEILGVDFRDAGARLKADNSPVTRADEAAHAAIMDGLAQAAPGVPVISEEAVAQWQGRSPPDEFLLVDPLDGTAEFLAGRLEYTVNIALVRGGTPVVGVIAAPALGLALARRERPRRRTPALHGGQASVGSARSGSTRGSGPPANALPRSAAHTSTPQARRFSSEFEPVRLLAAGSALKFCRLAEGAIDIYPRLAPTSEWDVAAGHALVIAAGGALLAADGGQLRYGGAGDGFRVPGFIAWGDPAAARQILSS